MHDVLIIGGGVIGLSLAWDLARHGRRVQVIDRGPIGREASWAGAGILPPARWNRGDHPYDQLRGLASELHPPWAAELQSLTGIDTGYRRCGGLYLARTPGEAAALTAWAATLREEGVTAERLSHAELSELEPALQVGDSTQSTLYSVPGTEYSKPYTQCLLLPDEAQLRNPRHLKALVGACLRAGVAIDAGVAVEQIVVRGDEVAEVVTSSGSLKSARYCFASGAWTGQLLQQLHLNVGVVPIRGQMVLFRTPQPLIRRIVNLGSRYLVPRDDGRLLAGSTEEEAGFDKRTTDEAIAELVAFAQSLVPALKDAVIEQAWAGLRPGSFDGLPYLGPLPGIQNAFVASGHFRSGLFLSPATAVVTSELIRGEQPQIGLGPFAVGR